jgi:mono/diheme cytochrome c family protein
MATELRRKRETIRPRGKFWASVMTALLLSCSVTWAQGAEQKHSVAKTGGGDVARGQYIVEGLAVCGQCHTPMNSAGEAERSKTLEGAPVWLQSAEPNSDWPLQAPRLAGTPPGTDDEMIKLLTTGIWRDGKPLRPPMPQFRMSHEDAQAVLAYLKSLNPKPR